MTLRSILHYPDNRLRQHCPEHTSFDDSLKELVSDMFETMYHEKGIGLSAIQINVITRVITIDVSKEQNQKLVLINPVILEMSEPILFDEGCLSVPGFYEKVERFNHIKYEAKDINGNTEGYCWFKSGIEELFSILFLPGFRNSIVIGANAKVDELDEGSQSIWIVPPTPS